MGINIQAKSDYSFLFSGLGSGSSGLGGSTFLSDYASIKNGSYAKLMKAYYSKNSNDTVKSLAKDKITEKTDASAMAKVQTTTDALKESADTLLEKGSKSVFNMKDITTKDENGVETTQKGYDTASIYKAVDSFVTNYNSVIGAAKSSDNNTVINRTKSMVGATAVNTKMLGQLGITINSDSTLSLDKDTFMKADMSKAKSLFSGNGSYAYRVSAQASMINFTADREASKMNTYNFKGNYTSSFNNGNLFNSYF